MNSCCKANNAISINEKAESLANSSDKDIITTMRELNTLHRLWKNDLGPVDKKHSDKLWKRFQESSHLIKKIIYLLFLFAAWYNGDFRSLYLFLKNKLINT